MNVNKWGSSGPMQDEMVVVRKRGKWADCGIVEENKLEQQQFPYLSRFPRVDHYPRPKFI